jgi:hypothetical protein
MSPARRDAVVSAYLLAVTGRPCRRFSVTAPATIHPTAAKVPGIKAGGQGRSGGDLERSVMPLMVGVSGGLVMLVGVVCKAVL